MTFDPATYPALVTAPAVLCRVIARSVRIPSILILLVVGFAPGPARQSRRGPRAGGALRRGLARGRDHPLRGEPLPSPARHP
uniref:Uncharacterized protein n=1 Tax=Janibacter limosus TaxID=53458 RepID=A0AC61U1E9_9MICO|nr:hypothetical protein [Janibacter limosus]